MLSVNYRRAPGRGQRREALARRSEPSSRPHERRGATRSGQDFLVGLGPSVENQRSPAKALGSGAGAWPGARTAERGDQSAAGPSTTSGARWEKRLSDLVSFLGNSDTCVRDSLPPGALSHHRGNGERRTFRMETPFWIGQRRYSCSSVQPRSK